MSYVYAAKAPETSETDRPDGWPVDWPFPKWIDPGGTFWTWAPGVDDTAEKVGVVHIRLVPAPLTITGGVKTGGLPVSSQRIRITVIPPSVQMPNIIDPGPIPPGLPIDWSFEVPAVGLTGAATYKRGTMLDLTFTTTFTDADSAAAALYHIVSLYAIRADGSTVQIAPTVQSAPFWDVIHYSLATTDGLVLTLSTRIYLAGLTAADEGEDITIYGIIPTIDLTQDQQDALTGIEVVDPTSGRRFLAASHTVTVGADEADVTLYANDTYYSGCGLPVAFVLKNTDGDPLRVAEGETITFTATCGGKVVGLREPIAYGDSTTTYAYVTGNGSDTYAAAGVTKTAGIFANPFESVVPSRMGAFAYLRFDIPRADIGKTLIVKAALGIHEAVAYVATARPSIMMLHTPRGRITDSVHAYDEWEVLEGWPMYARTFVRTLLIYHEDAEFEGWTSDPSPAGFRNEIVRNNADAPYDLESLFQADMASHDTTHTYSARSINESEAWPSRIDDGSIDFETARLAEGVPHDVWQWWLNVILRPALRGDFAWQVVRVSYDGMPGRYARAIAAWLQHPEIDMV